MPHFKVRKEVIGKDEEELSHYDSLIQEAYTIKRADSQARLTLRARSPTVL